MNTRICFCAVGLLVIGAGLLDARDDAREEAVKKERMKYQGTWQVVSLEIDGNKAPEDDVKKIKVVNEADGKWSVQVDGKTLWQGKSEIDPAKIPKTIDFTPSDGQEAGQMFLGIYELSGDSRKLCYARPGGERPKEFSSEAGSGQTLIAFQREKQ